MKTLFIVSTPIGNLQDITIRAIKTLFSVDIVLAENPTKTSILIDQLKKTYPEMALDKKPKLISFNEYEEPIKLSEAINYLKDYDVALVSSAGTPIISDPGYKLVIEAYRNGVKVVPIPGPSAAISAISISGLPSDKFLFVGFLNKSIVKKTKFLENLKSSLIVMSKNKIYPTVIAYESPHRISETLQAIKTVYGNINVVLARELTKIHEERVNDNIENLLLNLPKKPLGEYCVMFCLKN